MGASGTRVLRFEALAEGCTTLRLVYYRPWGEGEAEPEQTFSVDVVVR